MSKFPIKLLSALNSIEMCYPPKQIIVPATEYLIIESCQPFYRIKISYHNDIEIEISNYILLYFLFDILWD